MTYSGVISQNRRGVMCERNIGDDGGRITGEINTCDIIFVDVGHGCDASE